MIPYDGSAVLFPQVHWLKSGTSRVCRQYPPAAEGLSPAYPERIKYMIPPATGLISRSIIPNFADNHFIIFRLGPRNGSPRRFLAHTGIIDSMGER